MSIRQQAMQCIGRPVRVHSTYGVHYGILHHVDDNGIFLRQMRAGQLVSTGDAEDAAELAPDRGDADADLVFFPFFFLPWIALWGLYPWGWYW